ncbi:MAG TPA: cobamide remodeling phosphodiesterase CbiR [Desulfomonilaceae bacterium]|nr:cobamide remodeling phosphodiesterase CbiR [Desulfomonilaceae bacterium]
MRLGATSYIYPADIITNARRLAGSIDDIELVIFEVEQEANLPDPGTIEELIRVGADHNMTYTVHLPTDIGMADKEPCVEKAIRVIRRTEGLSPHAFIVHLDSNPPNHRLDPAPWLENSLSSLEILCAEMSEPEKLSVENLENHSPEMIDSILERIWVSCCIDVGHLWKQALDPLPSLTRWMPRARVVHIHGVGNRDHKRLSLIPDDKLDPVVKLLHENFDGVLTFEIFNERDLIDSMRAFRRSLQRIC